MTVLRREALDRKTVRRCLKLETLQAYQRPARAGTLLAEHADFMRERAAQVRYSAQVHFLELKARGYAGSVGKSCAFLLSREIRRRRRTVRARVAIRLYGYVYGWE